MTSESIARIDELTRRVEALPDPFARASAVELVQAVLALHAEALDRMMAAAPDAVPAMAADDLVSSVLALHGLHPDPPEARVRRAVEKLALHFDSRGAGVELLEVDSESARLRFTGSRPGAGAAARRLIEDAIAEAAPEIVSLAIEGVEEAPAAGFVPLASLAGAGPR